jgi:hypothetical protein
MKDKPGRHAPPLGQMWTKIKGAEPCVTFLPGKAATKFTTRLGNVLQPKKVTGVLECSKSPFPAAEERLGSGC